jgi:hypothetical protein
MSSVVISGDTSGAITMAAPAVAGSNTQTLVAATGTLAPLIAGTAQTASGSSVDFTGIPSWVKRITVMINGLSYAAAGAGVIQIGTSSGLTTTGYSTLNTGLNTTPTISVTAITNGFSTLATSAAAAVVVGKFEIVNINGNTWLCTGTSSRFTDAVTNITNGAVALSGTLDRLSLVATTSTFDAGTINILYE